jgi:hypothetical protein
LAGNVRAGFLWKIIEQSGLFFKKIGQIAIEIFQNIFPGSSGFFSQDICEIFFLIFPGSWGFIRKIFRKKKTGFSAPGFFCGTSPDLQRWTDGEWLPGPFLDSADPAFQSDP